ncbi:Cytochrome c (plasmid) [Caballeronia sp. SBC1]|nr:Cytochrome c [Caballeronia sp. SBC2]QIN67336.1 Cytochrome c [Caballeronia sp. SBC1]
MGKRWVVVILVLLACNSVGAYAADNAAAEKAPDTMQARVMGCAACHGGKGEGTGNDYYPRLAGKPAGYLYNQLLAFRDGRRNYPPMNYLLAYLPAAYLKQIADHFAAERPPFPAPAPVTANPVTLALGKSLVSNGDASRKIPACAACHGAALTGMEPAIPGLLGLHSDYITAQLGAWRYGTRKTFAPDCMHEIATRLDERGITAIAAYLASLPAPENPVPVAVGSLKMPLACGTEPNN